ncbi:MAG: sodium:proton antiporter [Candidatus Nezhaarchaeota archaeon]|nr:sodium:proton antiporter [Candidatus Nezhaarchaeota archaeon]
MRAWVKALVKACAIVLLVALLTSILLGATGYTPSLVLRPLAEFYLRNSFNPYNMALWAADPEVVTAMLWDYRGLDTVFESTVFFLAIVGGVALFRFADAALASFEARRRGRQEEGLSIIVKVVTRIVFVLIVALSVAVLYGPFMPGGGFQSGSIFSVAPLLAIAAFSRRFVEELGLTRRYCSAINAAGLIAISLIALFPLASILLGFAGAFIIQNQLKPWLPVGSFSYPVLPGLLAGSLTLFDFAEYFTVAFGFTLTFILLSLPEDFFRGLLRR